MKTIFTCLLVSVALFGFAQQNTFKVRAFAISEDYIHSYLFQIIQLNNGNFIGVGFISPFANHSDIYVLKIDSAGTVLASKRIDISNFSEKTYLSKTNDGGFIISSRTIIKFNSDLTIQWQKNYGVESALLILNKIIQTPDNGYLLTGDLNLSGTGSYSVLLVRIDSVGNVLFSKRLSDYRNGYVSDMTATTDSNYAIISQAHIGEYPYLSAEIIKVKPDGTVLWTSNLTSDGSPIRSYSIVSAKDGGLLIAGELDTTNGFYARSRFFMAKLNSTGNRLWSKKMELDKDNFSYANSVTEGKDGSYVFAGALRVYDGGNFNSYGYLVKTDTLGNVQSTNTFEPKINSNSATFNSIIATADGGYATGGGFYESDYQDGSSIYKFDNNLQICNEVAGSQGVAYDFGHGAYLTNATVTDVATTSSDVLDSLLDVSTSNYLCSNALPLQLLSFNTTLQNKSVAVQWTTANEVNTSYFTVERSKDAIAFTALQQVTAKGNSAGMQSYTTTDLQPLPGTSYYRLKETDKDGKITYSSVVPVTVLSNGVVIISPNPVRDAVRIIIQSESNAIITCQVIDMKGNVLAAQKTAVVAGRNEILIPATSLAKGVYLLKVIGNKNIQTIRFVKE